MVNTEDQFALLAKLANKQFGTGAVFDLKSGVAIPSVPKLTTGSLKIDIATGGGIGRGRIFEVYGQESSGKTTLCLHIIAEAQKDKAYREQGKRPFFIDMENALDLQYASKLGVDIHDLIVAQPGCGEDALQLAEMYIKSSLVSVCIIDSVATLVPRAELEGEIGDSHMGLQSRLMSQALRILSPLVNKTGSILGFTNQIRMKIGVVYGNPEVTSGGNALKFYASTRFDIRREVGKATKDSDGDVTRIPTKIKVVKNKLAPPFRVAEVDMEMNVGINICAEILDIGVDMGLIGKSGHYYEVVDPRRQLFFQEVADKDPQTLEELKAITNFNEIVDPESVEFKRVIGPTIKGLRFLDSSWRVAGRDNAIQSLMARENKALREKLLEQIRSRLDFSNIVPVEDSEQESEETP